VETTPRKPYSRREVIVIIFIIVVAAFVIGALNTTTATVSSVSAGPLSISEYAVCNGFGEPTYYSSMDQDINFTSYQYGHCYFGFWFSNGQPLNTTDIVRPVLD
jgi:hypothetical protein